MRFRPQLNSDIYRRPLANRALQAYAPGSTVKPLLASAGLTENVITPQTTVVCNGFLFANRPTMFRCSIYQETNGRVTHGPLELEDALALSCNIYFYTLGGKLGIDRLVHWFDAYGLGRDSGFELPESDGVIPRLTENRDASDERTEALQLGIGEGPLTATPLQMANAYATLLRSGLEIAPRILLNAPQVRNQRFQLDPAILATVKSGMRAVITRGTAKEIFTNFHLPIAGKTGTADTSRPAFDDNGQPVYDANRPLVDSDNKPRVDKDGQAMFARASEKGTDAWFLAYAPASEDVPPKFIVAAVKEFGGYGGKASAPMVKEALMQLERHHYLDAADIDRAGE